MFDDMKHLAAAKPEAVKRAGFYQVTQDPRVYQLWISAPHQVHQIVVIAALARIMQFRIGFGTNSTYHHKAGADGLVHLAEFVDAQVNVRRQDFQSHLLRLSQDHRKLPSIAES